MGIFKTWPRKTLDDLKKCYNQGFTYPDISAKIGRSIRAIEHVIRELRVVKQIPKVQPNRKCGSSSVNPSSEIFHYRTLFDQVGKSILTAVDKLPKYHPVPPPRIKILKSLDEEERGLLWSDSQVGQVVRQKETGGIGRYDYQVFLKRLSNLKEGIVKIERYHPPAKIINVFFLGDIIENATIFLGQQRQIDMGIVEQIIASCEEIVKFLLFLNRYFEKINCYCVVGNHGRVGKPGELSPTDNLEYLLYYIIKQRLSNVDNIHISISESWFMVVQRMTSRFFMIHGEDIRSWMTIPFYSAERAEARWQKMTRAQFDYFLLAHHHQSAEFDNIIFNGTWVGGSEFSIKKLGKAGAPKQLFFSIHPKQGITWRRPIALVSPEEIKRVPVEIYK